MTDTPTAGEASAISELRGLDARFVKAVSDRDAAREALHAGIVKHLAARSARPGEIADHTPYDRNWIGQLGRQHEVQPLRGPEAPKAKPTYDPETVAAALAELDKLTAALAAAETIVDQARTPLHKAIRRHYPMMSAAKIGKEIKYDRNHVLRIVAATPGGDAK